MTEINSWLRDGARQMGAGEYAEAQCLLTLALIDAVTSVGQEVQQLTKVVERTGRRSDAGMTIAQIADRLAKFGDRIDAHLDGLKKKES